MENLTGLHILLTYTCNHECDHCFVWGSPWQNGTFTLSQLDQVLGQAKEVESITEIYFEGGEAFLFYPVLVEAVSRAKKLGFTTGIVSNGYWATGVEDARFWLQPLAAAGLDNLEVSCDTYHDGDMNGDKPAERHPALIAADELLLQTGVIAIDPPVAQRAPDESAPGLPVIGGGVMFRGRAARCLTTDLPRQPWRSFITCPYENLTEPGRLHLDPFGNLHLCQGLVIGNLFEKPLREIVEAYSPETHSIAGLIMQGGPAQLVKQFELEHEAGYVDACHLCYEARDMLRSRFPAELGPDNMYGVWSKE